MSKLDDLFSFKTILHNDLHSGNLIYNKNNIYFIDFEYAEINNNFYEILNLFSEITGIDGNI